MKILAMVFVLSGAAWAQQEREPGLPQDPPRPPVPDPYRPVRNPDEVRAWLKENEPETFHRLTVLQDERRHDQVAGILAGAARRMDPMGRMAEMKERDPKGFERMTEMRRLERESLELAGKVRHAAAEEW